MQCIRKLIGSIKAPKSCPAQWSRTAYWKNIILSSQQSVRSPQIQLSALLPPLNSGNIQRKVQTSWAPLVNDTCWHSRNAGTKLGNLTPRNMCSHLTNGTREAQDLTDCLHGARCLLGDTLLLCRLHLSGPGAERRPLLLCYLLLSYDFAAICPT